MQVGLVNDGPVGVDYRSEDGVVKLDNLIIYACSVVSTNTIFAALGDIGDPDKPTICN